MISSSRSKLFIENFVIYGFGSVIGQIIPLIMLPILTRIYPSSEYIGLYDSVSVLVSLASQVAMLGMAELMFRFYFENEDEDYRKVVVSTTLFTLVISGIIVTALVVVFRKPLASLVLGHIQYTNLVIISSVTIYFTVINAVIAAPTRLRNQRGRYLIVNIFSSLASYTIAIPIILHGLYEIAMPIAFMCTIIITDIIFLVMNHHDFSLFAVDNKMRWKLLKVSIPSMPSFLFYWMISSAQRIFVTNILGIDATGIYSVGSKISSVSQIIYAAFGVGWQYFVFSTMKDEDHVQLISKVFDYLAGISFFSVCLITIVSHSVFKLLFEPVYSEGAWIMPILFLVPLIQMLYQSITSQYTVIKKTYVGPCCLAVGTCFCIWLDVLLIPILGLRGAAIANLTGFTVTLCIMAFLLHRRKLLLIRTRILYSAILTYVTLATFVIKPSVLIYDTISGIGALIIFWLYLKDGLSIARRLVSMYKNI